MKKLPFVTIVSLNWNSGADIIKLFESIYKSDYPKNRYEIIMVDNGSSDNSLTLVSKSYPKVKIISLKKNVGVWARNYAFKKAKGGIIVTLDSDAVIPHKETLGKVIEKLSKNPNIGILGVKIVNKKTNLPEYSPFKLNFYTGVISMLDPNKPTYEATWVPFIMSAMHKSIFKKVGFIKRLFFYGEDMNFCLKVRKSGLKVYYWPGQFVYHYKGSSTPKVSSLNKFHLYYQALFGNVWEFGNIIQKITLPVFQLIIIPPLYTLYFKKSPVIKPRLRGFWSNIKILSFETKIIVAAMPVGIILRLLALTSRDLWFDEAFTYHIARLPLKDLLPAVLTDNNPPLYYLLIHFILNIGKSVIFLRLPSLIINLLVAFVILKVTKSKLASSLFLLSPLEIYMSSEARLHSLAMLFVVLIIYFFTRLARKPEFKWILLLCLSFILGLYTQYYIALLFIPLTILVVFKKTEISIRKWLFILLLIVAAILPWLLLSSQMVHNGCACSNTLISLPASLVSPILAGIGDISLRYFTQLPYPIFLLFATVSVLVFVIFIKGIKVSGKFSFYFLIPLLFLSVGGLFLPVYSPKAFAIFSPIFFIILAKGIPLKFKKIITVAILLALFFISVIEINNPFFQGQKFMAIVKILVNNNIPILHISTYTFYPLNYYIENRQQSLITSNPLSPSTVKFIGGTKTDIDTSIKAYWLIDTNKWTDNKEYDKVKSKLLESYKAVQTNDVGFTKVTLLEHN